MSRLSKGTWVAADLTSRASGEKFGEAGDRVPPTALDSPQIGAQPPQGSNISSAPPSHRGHKSTICEEFSIANLSLAIPTWVNVKRTKGKPAYYPLSTVFRLTYRRFLSTMTTFRGRCPPALPLACARIQMSAQPLVPAVGTMGDACDMPRKPRDCRAASALERMPRHARLKLAATQARYGARALGRMFRRARSVQRERCSCRR